MLKNVMYQTIIRSFESARKRMLADVIYYCKTTSVVALDGIASFARLKDVINTCKHMRHSPTIGWHCSVQ